MYAALICENTSGKLWCYSGQVLNIMYASYGRSTTHTRCSWSRNNHCHSKNSMIAVRELCQGYSVCWLTATNTAFDNDPCPEIPKYLEVWYQCRRRLSPTSSTGKSVATTSRATATVRSRTTEETIAKLPTELADVTSDTTHEISTSFGSQYQQSSGPGIIAAIAGAGIAALLLILLASILFKRRHRSSHSRQTVAEERHNGLYEMNGGYVAAADNSDPGDVTYAQVNKGPRSVVAVSEQSSDNAYAYADQNAQADTGNRTMVDNIIYGTQ